MFLSGLKLLLASHSDITVVGEAANVEAALAICEQTKPDIIVTDLVMPGEGGFGFLQRLRERCERGVVALSYLGTEEAIRQALSFGARGYVSKSAVDTTLLEAIRKVFEGGLYVDPRLGHDVQDWSITVREGTSRLEQLSAREREVLRQVALGYTNKEIGLSLGISEKTVETYRQRIREKLDIKSRVEFCRVAAELGLVVSHSFAE